MALSAGLLLHGGALAQTGGAGAPLSAIDWLSDSIAIPEPSRPDTALAPRSAAVPRHRGSLPWGFGGPGSRGGDR